MMIILRLCAVSLRSVYLYIDDQLSITLTAILSNSLFWHSATVRCFHTRVASVPCFRISLVQIRINEAK